MTTLPIGRPYTMTSGTEYALPAATLQVFEQGAGTLQVSNDRVTWANHTGNEITGAWVRSNGGDTIIYLAHH